MGTWLGSFFLDQLSKNKHVCEQLKDNYGDSKVNDLLNADYVLIDFQLCLQEVVDLPLTDFLSVASIVQQFSTLYNRRLFLHFDEIDLLLSQIAPVLTSKSDAITAISRLHEFWTLLTPILFDSPVYCSGRTSILYALGRHMYNNQGITSPFSQSKCILLKPFEYHHVLKLVRSARSDLTEKESGRLAQQIFSYTNGIPRLVAHSITYSIANKHCIFP